jgi:hypothetical protein
MYHHTGLITHPYGQLVCVHAQLKHLNINLGGNVSGWVMGLSLGHALLISGQAGSRSYAQYGLGGTCAMG